jgi:hypothetical protein
MRVEIDLPDWVDERHLRLFAGVELVAVKLVNESDFRVKDVRCNWCGKCCMNLGDRMNWPVDENGTCKHLRRVAEGWECSIYINAPRGCHHDPIRELKTGECCITYR